MRAEAKKAFVSDCHSERSDESSRRYAAFVGSEYPNGFFVPLRMTAFAQRLYGDDVGVAAGFGVDTAGAAAGFGAGATYAGNSFAFGATWLTFGVTSASTRPSAQFNPPLSTA